MPIPLVVWAGSALVAGVGFGGYKFGEEAGESVGKAVPWIAGSVLVYALINKGGR